MFPDSDAEARWLKTKLAGLEKREHIPKDLAGMLGRIYSMQIEAREEIEQSGSLSVPRPLTSPDRHIAGEALLPRTSFPLVEDAAVRFLGRLLRDLTGQSGPLGQAAETLLKKLNDDDLNLPAAFAAYLAGDEEFFRPAAALTPDTPMAFRFVVQASLAPGIEAVARSIDHSRGSDASWPHGYCPVCGSLPFIGQLRDKEGVRFLTCSFCRTSYRVKRIQCPFCGEEEHAKLLFFTSPEEPGYRVDVCATCKNYIKTADFRELDRVSLPLLDDLESLSLDILARKAGYTRPTLSGWGF